MFTGIVETTGIIQEVKETGSNKTFLVRSGISNDLNIDQSISHNGVCLTVEAVIDGAHRVTAIDETLKKTNLGDWKTGDLVNLERCLPMNGRLDGHLVQGHVDTTGKCLSIKEKNGSWEYRFSFSKKFAPLVIEKGSISVNGISLTAFKVDKSAFSVAIIPYTFEHTNIRSVKVKDLVNLEFDMVGKYILRRLSLKK
jgi:riboflavin synthase